jgi:hypothetical protein
LRLKNPSQKKPSQYCDTAPMRHAFRMDAPMDFAARIRDSPHCHQTFEAVVAAATDPEIQGVEVVRRPALIVSPAEMLDADGYLLGSPANLGYMSGALKHAFDVCYYPCLDTTRGGSPFAEQTV